MRGCLAFLLLSGGAFAADWPAWRGPAGNGSSSEQSAPLVWDAKKNIRWKALLPGEGASTPVIVNGRIYLTASQERGTRRSVLAIEASSGKLLWQKVFRDDDPERTSALTGHAASSVVADGKHVVAFLGNAGVVCLDPEGNLLWQTSLGIFDTELGLATSPVLQAGKVFVVCDHDGDRFTSFESFLIALDVTTGKEVWKTPRRDHGRSWATPLVVPLGEGRTALLVAGDNAVRAYEPGTGKLLWSVPGLETWVAPSPIQVGDRVFAASGRNGPVLALDPSRPEGKRLAWQRKTGGPYICSPVAWREWLYLPHESGLLLCVDLKTGKEVYRRRIDGKFLASPVVAAGRLYWTDEAGLTRVIQAGPKYVELAANELGEGVRASLALSDGVLYLRGEKHLFAIVEKR